MAYRTLEEIRLRKEQLSKAIANEGQEISNTWQALSLRKDTTSRTEYFANLVGYGITAFDAIMTIRKLHRNYGGLLSLVSKKRKK